MRTFFAPGRTELAGNHTDHQNGRVLAASVALGVKAAVEPSADLLVNIESAGYVPFTVDLSDTEPHASEFGSSVGLVRGVAAGILKRGGTVCGFDAQITSTLPDGGGLSSSAAFEILMGRIWNGLCNDGRFDALTLAQIGQEAENRFFGKPSGLMDQLACATDGAVYVDFQTMETRSIPADFAQMGYVLSLTDTGGSHAGLTDAYAAIPADMRSVARRFGKERLSDVNPKEFYANRKSGIADDRAAHFFEENERVSKLAEALEQKDMTSYLRLMNESGRSSEQLLKNIKAENGDDRLEQGLKLAASLLDGIGAWRVHGGGFAGSVQALVPVEAFPEYQKAMEDKFGKGCCRVIQINR